MSTLIAPNSRDVTERRALERELHDQALHDALTPNRTLFLDRVVHALSGEWTHRTDHRGDVRRPRRLPGRERQSRTRSGRSTPQRCRRATSPISTPGRHRRAPRRRRVRDPPRGRRRPGRGGSSCTTSGRRPPAADRPRHHIRGNPGQSRYRAACARSAKRRRVVAQRRPGDVHGETARQGTLRAVLTFHARRSRPTARCGR